MDHLPEERVYYVNGLVLGIDAEGLGKTLNALLDMPSG